MLDLDREAVRRTMMAASRPRQRQPIGDSHAPRRIVGLLGILVLVILLGLVSRARGGQAEQVQKGTGGASDTAHTPLREIANFFRVSAPQRLQFFTNFPRPLHHGEPLILSTVSGPIPPTPIEAKILTVTVLLLVLAYLDLRPKKQARVPFNAYARRWLHALVRLHRMSSAAVGKTGGPMTTIWIGCDCGRTFWGTRPDWWDKFGKVEVAK